MILFKSVMYPALLMWSVQTPSVVSWYLRYAYEYKRCVLGNTMKVRDSLSPLGVKAPIARILSLNMVNISNFLLYLKLPLVENRSVNVEKQNML